MHAFTVLKHPPHFDYWLKWHTTLGINLLLYFDGHPSNQELAMMEPYLNRLVWFNCFFNENFNFTAKQAYASRHAVNFCIDNNVEYLAHFDDDELLFCPEGIASLETELDCHPNNHAFILENFEAVKTLKYYQPHEPFFSAESSFRIRAKHAYGNGKAIGRCSHGLIQLIGAHRFRQLGETSEQVYIDTKKAAILHYPFMTFENWARKSTIWRKKDQVSFGFYKKSQDFMSKERSIDEQQHFYFEERMRVDDEEQIVSLEFTSSPPKLPN